jgi:succinoglycan biosynthesis transport protein ExoP
MSDNKNESGREKAGAELPIIRGYVVDQVRDEGFGRTRLRNRIESEPTIGDYLLMLKRHILASAFVMLLVVAGAGIYTFTSTPLYRSEAVLELSRENANPMEKLNEAFASQLYDKDYIETQMGILHGRALAQALIDKMDLKDSAEFKSELGIISRLVSKATNLFTHPEKPDPTVQRILENEALLNALSKRVEVKRVQKSNLISVSMIAKDRSNAHNMLQNYVTLYLDQNLDKRRRSSIDASFWLNGEIEKASAKLTKSIKALVAFTDQHGMVSLEDQGNHILTFFNKAADELVETKKHRMALEAFKEDPSAEFSVLPENARPADLKDSKQKLVTLESEYAQLREIYADNYPKVQLLKQQISFLKDKLEQVEKNLVSGALDTARKQEALQEKEFAKAKQDAMNTNSLGVQYAILKKEQETNGEIYRLLLTKSKELDLSTRIIGNNVTLVEPPMIPGKPSKPRKLLNMFLGVALGIMLGAATALALDRADNKVRSSEDVESKLELPHLGMVPDVNKIKRSLRPDNGAIEFLPFTAPKSLVSEAVRNLKTSVFLSAPQSSMKSLLIASAGPSEGKTFVSVAMASAIATGSKRVLVIDGDLRRPRVGKVFGKDGNIPGLSTILTRDDVSLNKALYKSRIPNVYYMPAGPLPPNPPALLESERMNSLMDQLKTVFDFIVFDSPPVVAFSDAQIIASLTDGAVLVVKHGHMPVELIRQARNMLAMTKGNLLGVVVNMANGGSSFYGTKYSTYYKYYGSYSSNGKKTLDSGKKYRG